jgi:hypothetical protein
VELVRSMEVLWRSCVDGVSRSSVHVAVRALVLVRLRFDMPSIAYYQPFTVLENRGNVPHVARYQGRKGTLPSTVISPTRTLIEKIRTDPAKAEMKYREALHPNAFRSAIHTHTETEEERTLPSAPPINGPRAGPRRGIP